ncbi:hypothetical protein L1987_57620 [Smallanthus sonchifolius]|uniref:Uncharacterized protein n=1 Tax=Smallanthus sonchifolius TaxID=185202 RepID=A0ACB9DE11_9ASTR|nr:hypothetical protein L1987_57620 [Smallanthus sonchifolius]
MTRLLEIGLLCVQEDARDRPTMEEVVSMLIDSSSLALFVLKRQAMVTRERSESTSTHVDDYNTGAVEEFISDLYPSCIETDCIHVDEHGGFILDHINYVSQHNLAWLMIELCMKP